MQVCESASVPTRARLFRVVTADRNICTTSQRFTTAQHFTPSHWVTGRNSTAVKLSSCHRGRGQGNLWSVKRGFGPLLSLSWQLQIQTCEKGQMRIKRIYTWNIKCSSSFSKSPPGKEILVYDIHWSKSTYHRYVQMQDNISKALE